MGRDDQAFRPGRKALGDLVEQVVGGESLLLGGVDEVAGESVPEPPDG